MGIPFADVPRVLLLGEASGPEFAPVRDWLEGLGRAGRSGENVSVQAAVLLRDVRRIKDDGAWWPDLIVVCQGWSDQFSGVDAHALFTWFPLARVVVCYGAWCESDGRTRHQWPLAVRTPVSLAAARLQTEWSFLRGTSSLEPPPLTANRGDLFGSRCAADGEVRLEGRTVFVASPEAVLAVCWRQRILAAGGRVVDRAADADWVLFDADPWPHRREALAELSRDVRPERIVALVGVRHREAEREIAERARGGLVDKLGPDGAGLSRLADRPGPSEKSRITNPE